MASFKNYFVDDVDVPLESDMKTADDYSAPELEEAYAGLRQAGVSSEAGRRSVDMTRRLAGMVVPPPEGEEPSDWAKIQAEGRSTTSPIPTVSASTRTDTAAPTALALPPVTTAQPAGKPDSAGKTGLPAPEAEAGGDDEERNLYLARLIARNAASFGAMGAGKSIDTGAVEALGERLKQVQALRAKREEQGLEQQRERETWGASNRATLASALAQWKGDEAKTAALEALAAGADTTKPSDFSRNVVNAVMTKPKVEGLEARTVTEEGKPGIAKGGLEVKRGTLVERERANRANEEIRRQALLVKQASDTKAARDVRAAGRDERAAEKAITDAMKTAESDKLGIAANIRDFDGLERVAPGFTRGQVPSWLGQGSITAALAVPALNKKAAELASALELFTAGIRNSLFGASLTGNEKASFDAIVSSGVTMPPDVLAANINRLRIGAAKFAQNHFAVAEELHPEVTGRVLRRSTLFGPALSSDGLYSDVWRLPAAPAAAGTRSPKPADKPGTKTLWNKKTGQWVWYTPDQEAKARAAGAVED